MKTLERLFWLIVTILFVVTFIVTVSFLGTEKVGRVFDYLTEKLR